ncbi:MAG: hypothetical protein RB292_04360 [Patescibacteria group bacterium]|jgi:hypothetical protein|nr:hypothetical protein [Patescibacteria group bacterium]
MPFSFWFKPSIGWKEARVKYLLVMVIVTLAGCASLGPKAASLDFYQAKRNRLVTEEHAKAFDAQAREARSRFRHRAVIPLAEDTALEVVDNPKADIINDDGYINGLPAVFINDSAYKLMVVVRDRQGQLLEWEIGPGNYRLVKLELGGHEVQVYRLGLDGKTPWVCQTMYVRGDICYHPEGIGHFYGGLRFFGR